MRNELLLAALGLSSLTSCTGREPTAAEDHPAQGAPPKAVAPQPTAPDLQALLKRVAEQPEPERLSPGAMCYAVALPFDRTDYVCPTCGAKTIHATLRAGRESPSVSIRAYRESVHKLNQLGLALRLDESALCSACKKEGADALVLEGSYQGRPTRCALRDLDDLRKLQAFVEGRLAWKDFFAREHPLKPELPRIRELLGMTE